MQLLRERESLHVDFQLYFASQLQFQKIDMTIL